MSGGSSRRTGSIAAEAAISATNALNHAIASRRAANISAPSGAMNAHSATAEPFSKPPRLHWSANGSARIIASCTVRKRTKRPVRAKCQRVSAEAIWYANGIAAGSQSPSAA